MCRNLLGHSQVCQMLVTLKQESEPGVNSINSNCWERECLQETTNLYNIYIYIHISTLCNRLYLYVLYMRICICPVLMFTLSGISSTSDTLPNSQLPPYDGQVGGSLCRWDAETWKFTPCNLDEKIGRFGGWGWGAQGWIMISCFVMLGDLKSSTCSQNSKVFWLFPWDVVWSSGNDSRRMIHTFVGW